jgi:hypothetical protein
MSWTVTNTAPGTVRAQGTHGDYIAFHFTDSASGWVGREWNADLRRLSSSVSADAKFHLVDASTTSGLDVTCELRSSEWGLLDPGVVYAFDVRATNLPTTTLLSGTIKGKRPVSPDPTP